MIETGVYVIQNTVTRDCYVGSTSRTFADRWAGHRSALKYGRGSKLLQEQWDRFGAGAFAFLIVERCDPALIRLHEAEIVALMRPTLNPPIGAFNQNTTATSETRKKQADAKVGRVASDETRNRMSATRKGRAHSAEHVAARVASRTSKSERYDIAGEMMTAVEIRDRFGVSPDLFKARLKKLGWDATTAATKTPDRRFGRQPITIVTD